MRFFKDVNINFLGKRRIAAVLSAVFIIVGVASLIIHKGPNYGIDFAGGVLVQVQFDQNINIKKIRESLKQIELGDSIIQRYGSDREFIIRVVLASEAELEKTAKIIEENLKDNFAEFNIDIRRVEMVGPTVGKELRSSALLAIAAALAGILIYISARFEFKFAVAAIIALVHDVLITVGLFSLTNKEMNLPIIAALLTIVGYSLNDTIVVFDRIRENLKIIRKKSYEEIVNSSINQTISRTLLTSVTTFIVVLCLFIFGGNVIHDFSFALMVGVIVGTYSSIFVASPVIVVWHTLSSPKRKFK